MSRIRKYWLMALIPILMMPMSVFAADEDFAELLEEGLDVLSGYSNIIPTVIALLLLTVLPTLLLLMTSYTRVLVVLSFTRNALGTQQMPPNQVIIGIALVLTFFIMSPTLGQLKETAYDPYVNEEISVIEALDAAEGPLKEFMFRETQSQPSAINMFLSLSNLEEAPETLEEMPMSVLVPAFITGEITKAFKIGFLIYLPFIMIDMIVASILMSMGMMMLPPSMISLPFKILLFVLVDGWELIMKTLIMSFRG